AKGKKVKPKTKQKFRMVDVKVGTLLLWVLALFMVLLISLGGLGGYFLWQNMESIKELERQDHRSALATRIGSDMMSVRVSLLSAARYQQEIGRASCRERARG